MKNYEDLGGCLILHKILSLIHLLLNIVFCKQFHQNEHFSPFEWLELRSASESIQAV